MNTTIRYGDYILLSSDNIISRKYFAASSLTEGTIKVISEKKDKHLNLSGVSLSLYPNFNEFVFRILPKLNYDTLNEFKKLNKSDHRYELLERRLEADEKINNETIRKMLGKSVKYGQSIQLFHDLTNSFLKVSTEKEKKRNLFKLKLTAEGCGEVHFKIVPGISLKREGQSINYDDKISLINVEMQMQLVFPKVESNSFIRSGRSATIKLNKKKLTKKIIKEEDLPRVQDLPITEQNKIFETNLAHATSYSSRFQRKDESTEEKYSKYIKCHFISYSRQKDRKDLRYGDFIQIKSYGKTQFSQGFLISETNYSGFAPYVKYRILKKEEDKDIMAFDSIFQIVPEDVKFWGKELNFEGKNVCKISLKHFLSGNLLTVKTVNGSSFPILSEDFYSYCHSWMKDPKNSNIIKMKKAEEKYRMDKLKKKQHVNNLEDTLTITEIIAKNYFKEYSLSIVREASAEDDQKLLSSSLLQILEPGGQVLKVHNKQEFFLENSKKCAYFQRHYYTLTVEEISTLDLRFVQDSSDDTFYFQHVDISTINKIIHYISILSPLVKILRAKQFSVELISEGEMSIKRLASLIKTSYSTNKQLSKGVYSKQAQSALRELSMIDIFIKFIYLYSMYDLPSHTEDYELFLNSMIRLMNLCCQDNLFNCYYLFQWNKLYVDMILGDVELEASNKACRIDVDKLISTIFKFTNMNMSVINKTIGKLLKKHDFKYYDRRSLNFLFSLIYQDKSEKRDINILEIILDEIMLEKNFNKIFRPFREKNGTIFIIVSESKRIVIDKEIYKKPSTIDYIIKNVQFATELCRDYPSLFLTKYRQFIPENLCLKMICDSQLSTKLRSELTKFYISSYLSAECQGLEVINYPEMLKIREQDYEEDLCRQNESLRMEALNKMRLGPRTKKTIKDFIFDYLENPENYIRLQPEFLESLLELMGFLVKRGFLYVKEIAEIRLALFNFLKFFLSSSKFKKKFFFISTLLHNKSHAQMNKRRLKSSPKKARTNFLKKAQDWLPKMKEQNLEGKDLSFISKMLTCLQLLEETIFDLRFEHLAHEEESSEFFNMKTIKKDMEKEDIDEELNKKIILKENTMLRISKEIASPPTHYAFTLLEVMIVSDIEVAIKSLEILITIYNTRYKFMKQIPYLQVVCKDEIMDVTLQKYLTISKLIYRAESKIPTISDPERNYEEVVKVFGDINRDLGVLMDDIVIKISKKDAELNKVKSISRRHSLGIDTLDLDLERGKKGHYLMLFNEVFINLDKLDLKQAILKNLEFINQIFRILDLCCEDYTTYAKHYKVQTPGQYFRDSILFGEGAKVERNMYIRNDIILKSVLVIIFCCIKNPENQKAIRKIFIKKQKRLFELFFKYMSCSMIKYFLFMINSIYLENLTLLIKIPQNDSEIIKQLVDNFHKKFTHEKDISTYTFMSLFPYSSFKSLSIYQNQIFLSDMIKNETIIKGSNDIIDFFAIKLKKLIKRNDGNNLISISNFSSFINMNNYKMVRIPEDISFATYFLKYISDICQDKGEKMVQDNQVFLTTNTIFDLLKINCNWWQLKFQLYRFLKVVYLDSGDIEENDWDIMKNIILEVTLEILHTYQEKIEAYHNKGKTIIMVDEKPLLPHIHFSTNTSVFFDNFITIDYIDGLAECVVQGIIPFIETFLRKMPNTGSRYEQETLSIIARNIRGKMEKRGRVLSMFKNNYMDQVRAIGHGFVDDNYDGNDEAAQKSKIDRIKSLKKEIFQKLKYYRDHSSAVFSHDPFADKGTSVLRELDDCLYYNYWMNEKNDKGINNGEVRHIHLNSNFISSDFFERLRGEDMTLLADHIIGMKVANKVKFEKLFKVFLDIILDPKDNKKSKLQALHLLRNMIKESKEKNFPIINEMVSLGVVEVICKAIMRFGKQPDYSVNFIELAVDILEEEEREIQDKFYDFLVNKDGKNEFMISMREFLIISYERLRNSEQLRRDVRAAPDMSKDEDLSLVKFESEENIHNLIIALEMLRLMCEGHNEEMQNYQREQIENGILRSNNVNMLKVVTEMLIKYQDIVDDFNIALGNAIFEYFVEILQGPCYENQIEICKTKLLETVEDMLMDFIKGKGTKTMHGLGQNSVSEYSKSELIRNIINFLSAVLEGTNDNFIITKISIHVNQDMFLKRLKDIYDMFYSDITKNFLAVLELPMKSKRKTGAFMKSPKKKKTGAKFDFRQTGADKKDEVEEEVYTVLINNKKDYNPVILEGILIWILLKSIGDVEESFQKRIEKMIKHMKKEEKDYKKTDKTDKMIEFFSEKTASIEIFNENQKIQKVYFPVHNVTKFLSDYTKKKFEKEVNRESANDKIKNLVENYLDFYDEMCHFQKLRALGIPVNLTYFEWLKNISLICVVIANVTLLASNPSPDPGFTDSPSDTFIRILGFIIMIIYLMIGGLWLLFNSQIDIKKTFRKLNPVYERISKIDSPFKRSLNMFDYFRSFFFSLLVNSYLLDLSMNITFAMLGMYASKVFFSFMLLDFVNRSDDLKNVIKSVTLNISQLLMTGILGVVIIAIFSSMAYFSSMKSTLIFVEDDNFQMCTNYPHCFLTMLGFGLRSGGGIGDTLLYPDYQSETEAYLLRFFNDFFFFMIVCVIYLNILFGIIIDTFAALRDQKNISGKNKFV